MAREATTLRGALWAMGLAGGLAAALVGASEWHWRKAREVHAAAEASLAAASQQFLAVDEDERLIRARYPEFRQLAAAGLLGEEQRLDWVEALRDADQTLGLPAIRYSIEAQQAYPGTPAPAAAPYSLRSSDMTLALGLLHEGDLIRLFDELRGAKVGLFSVEACALTRAPMVSVPAAREARVTGECVLRWVTLRPPTSTEVAP